MKARWCFALPGGTVDVKQGIQSRLLFKNQCILKITMSRRHSGLRVFSQPSFSNEIDSYVESTKIIWTDSWSSGEPLNYFDKIWTWGEIHTMFIVDADSALQSTFRPILKLNYELVSCISCSGRVASSTTSTTFLSCCQHRNHHNKWFLHIHYFHVLAIVGRAWN